VWQDSRARLVAFPSDQKDIAARQPSDTLSWLPVAFRAPRHKNKNKRLALGKNQINRLGIAMTIYVDDAYLKHRKSIFCHLVGDDPKELHDMAVRITLPRRLFKGDHYEVCLKRRPLAVAAGAVEIGKGDAAILLTELRRTGRMPALLELPLIRARRLRDAQRRAEAREAWREMHL
jgi:hypothetical protein